jgi:hypothetical protein
MSERLIRLRNTQQVRLWQASTTGMKISATHFMTSSV